MPGRGADPLPDAFVIPADRLPPGFAERLDGPPGEPAEPVPAATAVLLRDGAGGPEVLLLRRHRASGFVPGAYVFPGGRVDAADRAPTLLERAHGFGAGTVPDPAYWLAAVREVFEETGVLLARTAKGEPAPDAGDSRLAGMREALMAGCATLRDVLDHTGCRVHADDMVYVAHWITPVAEPRRYDTRFFLARLPAGRDATADPREMTAAVWLPPESALERFAAGSLPMVFPTVRTIESLRGYPSVAAVMAAFRGRPVAPVLPRLVRTDGGIGIVIDGDAG